jgi:EAL domain-containing protein (putative c-di-GMP-specific phosphodiesterase class I)
MNTGNNREEQRKRWFLEHVSTQSGKWIVALDVFPFVIGRDEDCNLKLKSKWVSRHHAEIHKSGDLLWIRDLGSTNGTFLNQTQIQKAELLEVGDLICFGKFEFHIRNADSVRHALVEDTIAMDPSEELAYLSSLEPLLRKLLRERTVVPHFQPILSFSDLQVVGYEILGRIGEIELPSNPVELFDVAACLGCASDLSVLFREVGVDVGRQLPGYPLLFANTAPIEMDQITSLVESLEKARQIAPSNRIVLEISEKAVTFTEEMEEFRDRLADLNIGLAFDDFGVGQIRLAELAKAPPDFLKFDMSLIRHIHLAPKRFHQMILTFVKAAQDLGIATLAEGIECPDESETCRQLGFEYAQGFFHGRPSPIDELSIA